MEKVWTRTSLDSQILVAKKKSLIKSFVLLGAESERWAAARRMRRKSAAIQFFLRRRAFFTSSARCLSVVLAAQSGLRTRRLESGTIRYCRFKLCVGLSLYTRRGVQLKLSATGIECALFDGRPSWLLGRERDHQQSTQSRGKKQKNRAYGEAVAALFVCSFTLSADFKQKSS